jgi:hypothetical protein
MVPQLVWAALMLAWLLGLTLQALLALPGLGPVLVQLVVLIRLALAAQRCLLALVLWGPVLQVAWVAPAPQAAAPTQLGLAPLTHRALLAALPHQAAPWLAVGPWVAALLASLGQWAAQLAA